MGENENTHDAIRKCVVMELEKGKQIATRLRNLLHNPVQDLEPLLFDELALQISRSFTVTLSMLSPCPGLPESTQICGSGGGGSTCSVESMKKPTVKDRRGCYKRRKTSDSWVKVSQTMEDGHAWRKYGQKKILNSESPRCYFRCTHKSQGCKALKQVQKLKEDSFLYQTTYFHHHTCTDTLMASHLIADPDPVDPNILSFQQVGIKSSTPKNIIPPVKEESLVISEGDIDHASEAKSSQLDPWADILVGSDFWLGYKPLWGPAMMMSSHQEVGSGLHSCGSTSFNEFDVEVNQLDNIEDIKFE